MRGSPYTDHGDSQARGKVHIGRIHAHHHIQRGNPLQFFCKSVPSSQRLHSLIFPRPRLQHRCLCRTAKQNNPIPFLRKHLYQSFHLLQRPYLPLVLGKRSHTHHTLVPVGRLHAPIPLFFCPAFQSAMVKHTVVASPCGHPACIAFPDATHRHAMQSEQPVHPDGPQHVVHIRHLIRLQRTEHAIQLPGLLPAFRGDILHIRHAPEQRCQPWRSRHKEQHLGIGRSPLPQHRLQNSHVAQRRQPDNQQPLAIISFAHFLL